MLDIFGNDAFSTYSLTESINILPYVPRRIGAMGLFDVKNPRTHVILLERKGDILSILETKPRGSGLTTKKPATRRDLIPLYIPHIPLDDQILASDVQGVRAFGTEDQLETVSGIVNERLQGCRDLHELTHEYHRIGAVKGIILDGDAAASPLLNLFTAFGITQHLVHFNLASDGLTLKAKCADVIYWIEDILGGQTYDHIHGFVGNDFFQALVNNAEVKETYNNQNAAFKWGAEQQGFGTMGRGSNQVTFGDITFENYRGQIGTRKFIELNEAHFFPVGVPGLFQSHFGPADTMNDVNTAGKDIYAMQEPLKWDAGVEIHTESNPLMICKRPSLLVKGDSAA